MCGTVMAPNVPCIKIWKVRNVGTAPWPCGTQLVWTGGYQFTNQVAVALKVCNFPSKHAFIIIIIVI